MVVPETVEKGAVKKQKKRLHPEKERMQPFLWYNVIVQNKIHKNIIQHIS